MTRNVRYALRTLGKNPGFVAVAVLTLGLGIGGNTAVFSLVNALVLRPLPYQDPDRLVALDLVNRADLFPWSYPMFEELRRDNRTFEAIAGFWNWNVNLTGSDVPERLQCEMVSAAYFPLLGVQAKLGRVFRPEEDREPDAHPLAVISDDLWREKFGGAPGLIGRTIHLNQLPFTVIGVAPPGFKGQSGDTQVWVPITMSPSLFQMPQRLANARNFWLLAIARLKSGTSMRRARAELEALSREIEKAYPHPSQMAEWQMKATPLAEAKTDPAIRKSLLIMLGAVGFVLLIACANMANLLLGRAVSRRREVAVRLAVGASRRALLGQFLTESVILSALGGLAGLLFAAYAIHFATALRPEASEGFWTQYARAMGTESIRVDAWVVAFNTVVSLLTGLLFGLLPAWQSSRLDLNDALKNLSGGGLEGFLNLRRFNPRSVLVVVEMALAVVLLAGAGLMIESFARLLGTRIGAASDHVLAAHIDLPQRKYNAAAAARFGEQLLDRMAALPGIQAAAICNSLPARGQSDVTVMNRETENGPEAVVGVHSVNAGYFRVFQIPLRRGRLIDGRDRAGARRVVVVNETAARRLWPGRDPIGRHVWLKVWETGEQEAEVVGVAGDVRYESVEKPAESDVYVSFQQFPEMATIAVRTAGSSVAAAPVLTSVVRQLDKDLPVYGVKTMDQELAGATSRTRFTAVLLTVFAALAVGLAGIGLYGVVAFSVAACTREMGLRMALGAKPADVLKLIVRNGVLVCLAGLLVGLPAAFAATRLLSSFLYSTAASDPWTFAGAVALLAGVAMVASYIPARRATRVDPLVALHYE